MVDDRKYLVLDDVVYSTQFTLLSLVSAIVVKYHDKPDMFNKDDIENLMIAKRYIEHTMEDKNIFVKNTFLNMALTRPDFDYFELPEDYQMWLLSKFHSLNEIANRISPIINIIGSPEVTIVYNDKNPIEKLILKKMRLFEKVPKSNVMTFDDFEKELNNGMTKFTNKHSRPSILTANINIIEKYQDEYSIIVPKIYRWISKKHIVGYVENWTLEDIEYNKEENNANQIKPHSTQS